MNVSINKNVYPSIPRTTVPCEMASSSTLVTNEVSITYHRIRTWTVGVDDDYN